MFLIGLTGGIASGKTTVAAMLAKLGAEIIDADLVAREVVAPGTEGLRQVEQEFGEQVLESDGSLSRSELAKLVFSDPSRRVVLEAILHPLIKARTLAHIGNSKSPIVLYVVPLLVEANVDYPFDYIVTVESGTEIQTRRLIESRGMTRKEALSRIQAQASEAQRVATADFKLDGALSLTELEKAVSALWDSIQSLARQKADRGKN